VGLLARLLNNRGVICLLETPPIRMVTKDGRSRMYGKPATFRVFHQAIQEIDR
jgi:hypothetical protein